MSSLLLNSTLQINVNDAKADETIEEMKALLGRVLLATAGFYNSTNKEDFSSLIRIDDEHKLSIYLKDSACYIGAYDTNNKKILTEIDAEAIIPLKHRYIDNYITKLSRAESFFIKHNKLPETMHTPQIEEQWEAIIKDRKEKELPLPTKISDILRTDKIPVAKYFWEDAKKNDSKLINAGIIKESIDLDR